MGWSGSWLAVIRTTEERQRHWNQAAPFRRNWLAYFPTRVPCCVKMALLWWVQLSLRDATMFPRESYARGTDASPSKVKPLVSALSNAPFRGVWFWCGRTSGEGDPLYIHLGDICEELRPPSSVSDQASCQTKGRTASGGFGQNCGRFFCLDFLFAVRSAELIVK